MTNKRVLIIDDEPDIRELLEITLIRMGLDTDSAESVSQAKELLASHVYHLCLTDMNLPDGDGIELVGYCQQHYPDMPIAMITAYGSVETAISALKAGAFDFISKPVDLKHLRDLVESAIRLSEPGRQSDPTASEAESELVLGEAPAIQRLKKQTHKLSRSQAPVYISGESGCGKELVARTIHANGPRAAAPFVPVNCGAIPGELMESEFFGHKKGSFSGAHEDKEGLFKAAHGGTLFLDEVADLPLSMQVKLLRAIQEKAVRPVGAQHEESIDVRILSATHKDLEKLVASGHFREDLFYRINVIRLNVPSLRERKQDIRLLVKHFLKQMSEECGTGDAKITPEALAALEEYPFPGNVRELENIIERAFTMCEDLTIQEEDLNLKNVAKSPITESTPKAPREPEQVLATEQASDQPLRPPEQSLEDFLEEIERREIEMALQTTKWNRTAAAKKLGMTFRALRYRLKKLDLD